MPKLLYEEDLELMFHNYIVDAGAKGIENEVSKTDLDKMFNEWVGDMETLGLIIWSAKDLAHYAVEDTDYVQ
jgi:hypothetical protein